MPSPVYYPPSPPPIPSEMARSRVSSPRWTPEDPPLVFGQALRLFHMKLMNRDIGGSHFNPLIPFVEGKKRTNSESVSFKDVTEWGPVFFPTVGPGSKRPQAEVSLEHSVSRKSLLQGTMALPLGTRVPLRPFSTFPNLLPCWPCPSS